MVYGNKATIKEIKRLYNNRPKINFNDINLSTSLVVKKCSSDVWAEITLFIDKVYVGIVLIQQNHTFCCMQFNYFDDNHNSAYINCKISEALNIYKHYLMLMGFEYVE